MAQLYVLRGKETGKVKIGITINFDKRLSTYKTHISEPIEVLTAFEVGGDGNAAYRLEQFLLLRCRSMASHGEWINPTPGFLELLKAWNEVYGGDPGEPACLISERQRGYVEHRPPKAIRRVASKEALKPRSCAICNYAWMLRTLPDGTLLEPSRCPNRLCRSRRWRGAAGSGWLKTEAGREVSNVAS